MRVVDGVADLAGVVERAGKIEGALTRDDRLERLAGDELHHDEKDVLLLFRGEDGDDVRMVQRGEQARLAQQLAEIEILFVWNLERDFLVDPGVLGEVNRSKAAAADRRKDLVLADDLTAKEHCARIVARPF